MEETKNKIWDDKFGLIEGVGKDAEIVTNEKGGKQSKAPMAMHLIDPEFLRRWFQDNNRVIENITDYMIQDNLGYLTQAIYECHVELTGSVENEDMALVTIAKVLQEGAKKYSPNNWRLIPQEEHLNHALIHYLAYKLGDKQDDHLEHCMCRLMMAYATEKSKGFEYNRYVA